MKTNTTFATFFGLSFLYCVADYHLAQIENTIVIDDRSVYDFLYHDLEITNQSGFENVLNGLDHDGQKRLFNTLVTNEVLYDYGKRAGLGEDDNDIKTIIIDKAQNAIEMRLLAEIDLSEREVHNYYANNLDKYVDEATINLELINLSSPSQDTVESLLLELAQTPSIAADDISDVEHMPTVFHQADESRLRAIFGTQIQQQIFADASVPHRLNEWQAGFETRFGYHLYRVTDYQPRVPVPFHQIKEQVANELLMSTLSVRYQQELQAMTDNFDVTYDLELSGEPDV
ncbi:hypothetical protein [Vibrio sp. WXL210]|uniref:peptidylprolyl isomerase n=1 Tax=Vibrio sp. WXL210 TaxID=3450709 RepID=UPI003EC73732